MLRCTQQNRQQRLQQHVVDAGMVIGSMNSEQVLVFRTCVVLFVQNNIIIISSLIYAAIPDELPR